MRYIEAFSDKHENYYNKNEKSIFLAGGISNCPNWQKEMTEMLSDLPIVIVNPRRENFDISDPEAARKQIEWEFDHLKSVDYVLFWFPHETLCPITLFEYGSVLSSLMGGSAGHLRVFVGCHPDYERRTDVLIQTELRVSINIHSTLKDLANDVRKRFPRYEQI